MRLAAIGLACLAGFGCAADDSPTPLLVEAPAPSVTNEAGNPITAHVNQDGRSDLIIPSGRSLSVLLSGADGFRAPAGMPIILARPASESLAADFNGDGWADLALASHDSYDVTILLGDGKGGFAAAPNSPVVARRGTRPHTHAMAAGDFNNDAKLDLLTANNDDDDLSLLLGDGRGGFAVAPRSPFACGRSPYPIAVADFDGDGSADVIVPNSAPGMRIVTVLCGDGKGGLSPLPGSPVTIAGGAFFAAAADLTGDGRPDAVITHNNDDAVTILLNDGHGHLVLSSRSPLTLGHNAWGISIADMDRDGHADIIAAADDAIRVFLGDGKGGFAPARGAPFPAPKGSWRLSLGDLNGDKKLDVVAKGVEVHRLIILHGN
jgi:hypothetical protein